MHVQPQPLSSRRGRQGRQGRCDRQGTDRGASVHQIHEALRLQSRVLDQTVVTGRASGEHDSPCCVYSRARIAILPAAGVQLRGTKVCFPRTHSSLFSASADTGSGTTEHLRAMSIDTLLEAARFLEWQAQQQQSTRAQVPQAQTIVQGSDTINAHTDPLRGNLTLL
uniref:Uncharacterized protein n=1 Tax=Knipowitschia caucasica TaxID=637954 RepID=A0AAV2JAQ6_KNICA